MMATTTDLLTFEEFEQLPENFDDGKVELIEGEVNRMPPPFTQHMRIAMRLLKILDAALLMLHGRGEAASLGEVFLETGCHIGSSWLIPDVCVTHAGQTEGKYLEGAPAIAVEVVSQANSAEMMQQKVKLYFQHGALEVWVIYPRTSSVSVHRGKTAVEFEGTLTSELLPGIAMDLSELFRAGPSPA
jgi:Uma2 family endonuclease